MSVTTPIYMEDNQWRNLTT